MENQLIEKPKNINELIDSSQKLITIAERLQKSGLFPNVKSPEGAFAICQYGMELGITPFMALQNINLISGKPAANAQLLLSLVQARGTTIQVIKETDTECEILFRKNGIPYSSKFTIEEAKKAGLDKKDNWKNYTKDMLFARAAARGCRRIDPAAITGLYTPDELGDDPKIGPENAKNITPQKEESLPLDVRFENAIRSCQAAIEEQIGNFPNFQSYKYATIDFVGKTDEKMISKIENQPEKFIAGFVNWYSKNKKEINEPVNQLPE